MMSFPRNRHIRAGRVGRKLVADKGTKPDILPTASAQQTMRGRHGLDASIERAEVLVDACAVFARRGGEHGDSASTFLTRWSSSAPAGGSANPSFSQPTAAASDC